MAIDILYIWNAAVGHCGEATETPILVEAEATTNAIKVRLHWDSVLLAFLEELWWSHLTSFVLLVEQTTPAVVEGQWAFAYDWPPNCAAPRRIVGATPSHEIPLE